MPLQLLQHVVNEFLPPREVLHCKKRDLCYW